MTGRDDTQGRATRTARIVFWGGIGLLAASLIFAGIVKLQTATPKDFSLLALDGSTIRLSEMRGKTVVLNFWASWCVPCTEEMPELESFYKAHQGGNIVVIGVNVGEKPDVARGFVAKEGVTFPIALDEDTSVATSYGMRGLPMTVVIDPMGLIHWNRLGQLTRPILEAHLP